MVERCGDERRNWKTDDGGMVPPKDTGSLILLVDGCRGKRCEACNGLGLLTLLDVRLELVGGRAVEGTTVRLHNSRRQWDSHRCGARAVDVGRDLRRT